MTSTDELLDTYFSLMTDVIGGSRASIRYYMEHLFRDIDLTNRRMLDIGGGAGVFSFYAACRGAREVVCLEPGTEGSRGGAAAQFERIGSRLRGLTNIRFERVTLQSFDSSNEKFDVILLHHSINHLDENACVRLLTDESARDTYRRIFKKIAVLAVDNAKLIACDSSRYNFFGLIGARNPIAPQIKWHKHQSPRLWAQLLNEAGFTNPRICWRNNRRVSAPIRFLLSNRFASYFQRSHFCLKMEKAPESDVT